MDEENPPEDVEYSPLRAAIRVSILILILFGLWQLFAFLFGGGGGSDGSDLGVSADGSPEFVSASVIFSDTGDEKYYRFTNFECNSCDGLIVYLSKGSDLTEEMEIGQIYSGFNPIFYVPIETDLSVFSHIVIWDESSENVIAQLELE